MDSRIAKLQTPDACKKFIANAIRLGRQDLADEARLRFVEIRASEHGAATDAEKECLQAIYAYEEALTQKNGRRTRASRTWQMIERRGILSAAERAVDREAEATGYTALVEMGLQQFTFEAVILRYPHLFSESSVERSRTRLQKWGKDDQ